MEVNKIDPPKPEPTFDIIGLSRDETVFLRDLLGIISAGNPGGALYNKLSDAVDSYSGQIWEFDRESASVGHLNVHTLYPRRR